MIRNKKILILGAMASIIIIGSVVLASFEELSKGKNTSIKTMGSLFEDYNEEKVESIQLNNNSEVTVEYDIAVEDGNFNISIEDEDGNEVFNKNDGTGEEKFRVNEAGKYEMKLKGDNAKGSYSISLHELNEKN